MLEAKLKSTVPTSSPFGNLIAGLAGSNQGISILDTARFQYQKSPLRYPGGKSRAVKGILSVFPENIERMCSPFLGGGSIELACSSLGIKVYGYDIFSPLIDFWQEVLSNPEEIAERAREYLPLSRSEFYNLQKAYTSFKDKKERATVFFVLNRSSFSGTTLSGGMSPGHKRFNNSAIERLEKFRDDNLNVSCESFRESLSRHENDFLYLDPPYANGQAIYGDRGDTHKDFDHNGLANILNKRDRWILSYNDCSTIRDLYKDFKFIQLDWTYGMNNSKKSNEVLILSKDLAI